MNQDKYDILICSTSVANFDRRMQRIAMSLKDAGHSVSWISRSAEGSEPLDINHSSLNPFIKSGFLFYAFFNIRLFYKLLFRRFDLVYSVDLDTVLPCYLTSKIRRKKIVFDAHEYYTEVPELINRDGVKKVWESVANFCLPNIKNNITVGPKLSQIFTERYKTDYTVVRNISPDFVEEIEIPENKNTMIYLGVVNEGRGVELAIESLVELKTKRLKIIGGGDLFEEMQSMARKFGVEGRVEFVGYVNPQKIRAEIEGCYLALNLLLSESQSYYYSLANKFFDYLQLGIPSINMAYPEYKNINDEYQVGMLIDSYNVSDLVSAIRRMDEPKVYETCRMGIKSAKVAFNWGLEEEKLNELVNNLK